MSLAVADPDSPFVLVADATQHASDVKHVAWQDQVSFWSASRDATARQFHVLPNNDGNLGNGWTLAGHHAFVNFVLVHPSLPLLDGESAIITGSNDRHVIVWSVDHGGIEAVLDAHSDGVRCGVLAPGSGEAKEQRQSVCPQGSFVTGGWDKVCVVWDGVSGKPRNTYVGHTNSVLCLAVPKGSTNSVVLSGSGDQSIHAWDIRTAKLLHAFTGHTDSVQALACMDDDRFVSSGNDGMVIVWSLSCRVAIRTFHAHDSLVFSLAYHAPSGLLFSASDDHSVKVWRDVGDPTAPAGPSAGPLQVIPHPCVVWTVAVQDETGDLVSGGGDGVVRVWSRDDRRMAPVDKLELLQAALSSRTIDVKEASGAAAAAIPDVASLASVDEMHKIHGSREGERRFFRNEGLVEVHLWTQGSWSKIGTVVAGPDRAPYTGAPLPREKKFYKGREVDYLFDVEVAGQYLKLPYNRGQNIFDAAQDFIHEHGRLGVSQESKEAIVQHILKLIDPQDAALLGAGGGSSPALGAAPDTVAFSAFAQEAEELRRRGGGGSGGANVPQSWGEAKKLLEDTGADVAFSTFAQEGKALLAQQQQPHTHTGSGAGSLDPHHSYTATVTFSPHVFRVFNVSGAKEKLAEFVGSSDYGPLLDQISSAVSSDHDGRAIAGQVEEIVCGLVSLLVTLEPGRSFPAVDAMRYAAVQPHLAMGFADMASDSLSAVWTSSSRSGSGGDTTVDTDRLVALRLLANLTSHTSHPEFLPRVQSFALAGLQEWIGLLRQAARSTAANQRAALLAVLQNVSLVFSTITEDDGVDEKYSQQVRSSVKALVGCIAEVALLWGLTDSSLVKLLECCLALRCCRGSAAVRASAATYVEQFLGPTLRLIELGSDVSLKAVKSALSRAATEESSTTLPE